FLSGPEGNLAQNRRFTASDGPNSGSETVERLSAGDYTLRVQASDDSTGPFQFRLVDISTATAITPDALVSGTNDPKNETDLYKFSANAGDLLYFNQISLSDSPNLYWRLLNPSRELLFSGYFADQARVRLNESGMYTLLVEGQVSEPKVG